MLIRNTWNYLIVWKQMINVNLDKKIWCIELSLLDNNTWNHLTAVKQMINIK